MESVQVISKIDEPTPCAGIVIEMVIEVVIVPAKSSDSVHICVDFCPLNDSVLRKVHPLPKVEETLAQLSGDIVFSKIDANCGFCQILLTECFCPFITFITPFGRYCFNKLPFGIWSASEHFQKQMNNILSGMPGVLCHMGDVLILVPLSKGMTTDLTKCYRNFNLQYPLLLEKSVNLARSNSLCLATWLMSMESHQIL